MNMKRFIACVLAVFLLLGLAPAALAAETPEISLSSGSAKAGETVTLTVHMKNNPGLAAFLIYLYFDTDTFAVDPTADIQLEGSFKTGGGMIGNSIAAAKKNGQYKGDKGKDGILVLWYSGTGADNESDGAVLKVKFHVSDDAANGTYQVGIGYSKSDTGSGNGERVALSARAGSITVSGGKTDGGGGVVEQPEESPFTDVDGHWAGEYIEDAYEMELMIGDEGKFRPDATLTRAEFAIVLWRIAGCPKAEQAASFTGLTADWYKDAVAWVEESGMMVGNGEGKFLPLVTVSREQVATVLHRMAGSPEGMSDLFSSFYDDQYEDADEVSSWAKEGVYWSIFEGIFCGTDSADLDDRLEGPIGATRAQIAVMLVRYCERV